MPPSKDTAETRSRSVKCYVAGPMRGLPELNFPAFDRCTAYLRSKGWTVFSPAERDRETGITADASGEQLKLAIMWDLDRVAESDVVVFLSGWETSLGARAEHALAVFLGKDIRYEGRV